MSDLDAAIKTATEWFESLSPQEQAAHRRTQRESWVIGEMMLEHPEMSREDAKRIYDAVVS